MKGHVGAVIYKLVDDIPYFLIQGVKWFDSRRDELVVDFKFPGGGKKYEEKSLITLRREIHEELWLDLSEDFNQPPFFGPTEVSYPREYYLIHIEALKGKLRDRPIPDGPHDLLLRPEWVTKGILELPGFLFYTHVPVYEAALEELSKTASLMI